MRKQALWCGKMVLLGKGFVGKWLCQERLCGKCFWPEKTLWKNGLSGKGVADKRFCQEKILRKYDFIGSKILPEIYWKVNFTGNRVL